MIRTDRIEDQASALAVPGCPVPDLEPRGTVTDGRRIGWVGGGKVGVEVLRVESGKVKKTCINPARTPGWFITFEALKPTVLPAVTVAVLVFLAAVESSSLHRNLGLLTSSI
jgi:hypothetical protein